MTRVVPPAVRVSWAASVAAGVAVLGLLATDPAHSAFAPAAFPTAIAGQVGPHACNVLVLGLYGSDINGSWQGFASVDWTAPTGIAESRLLELVSGSAAATIDTGSVPAGVAGTEDDPLTLPALRALLGRIPGAPGPDGLVFLTAADGGGAVSCTGTATVATCRTFERDGRVSPPTAAAFSVDPDLGPVAVRLR